MVLSNDLFINFLASNNIVIWAGFVSDQDVFKVANSVSATRYPCLALLSPISSRKMKLLHRFEGYSSAQPIIDKLNQIQGMAEALVATERNERASREVGRSIRKEQDDAYSASLRADREKVVIVVNLYR
jgi:FAS-associated factor 2